jgi:hypothetical protein
MLALNNVSLQIKWLEYSISGRLIERICETRYWWATDK